MRSVRWSLVIPTALLPVGVGLVLASMHFLSAQLLGG